MRLRTLMLLLAAVLLLTDTSYAQDAPPPTGADSIEQLRLTPEQRQKIRMILEETKTERQQINHRVREANVALDQALDAEPTDQNFIDQRLNEIAAAQVAQMRMRIQTELKIRRELRPEQLAILRQLRLQARDFMGAQRQRNQRPAGQGFRPNRRNIPQP
ncbi:MAG TPA: periplasmic heavy metal sensor [Pyrinomonadaceae bacterium]|nr:periplasmic heavy metal sensor [Pyrinomonadaceae bacterium]